MIQQSEITRNANFSKLHPGLAWSVPEKPHGPRESRTSRKTRQLDALFPDSVQLNSVGSGNFSRRSFESGPHRRHLPHSAPERIVINARPVKESKRAHSVAR
jgi:hypothetical protein